LPAPNDDAIVIVRCGTAELVTALIIFAPSLRMPPCS